MSTFPPFKLVPVLAGLLFSTTLHAQSTAPLPANWQRAGSISGGGDQTPLKTTPGTTLLVGKAGEPYVIAPATAPVDFHLTMDILMMPGTSAQLVLPAGKPIDITDKRLSKAPGLWQTVDVRYRNQSGLSRGAMLEKLAFNGVTVAEGQTLAGTPAGPVGIAVTNGSVAVRNLVYKPFAARNVARWSGPLNYTIYEGESANRDELAGKKVLKQDTTSALSYEVAFGQPRRYAVLFSGKLDALQAGDYEFELNQGGIAGMWLDGKELIPTAYHDLGQPSTGKATLTAGTHDVQVFFARSWPRPGLGLFVSQAGTRPQALHALSSLPDPAPVGIISVTPDTKTQLIRSFVQMPGEKTKRTHSLSVGSPAGIHYTLDLNQMALLQAWKGDFANVTEMWHERGEPQLLTPMGTTVMLPGQSAVMILTNEATAWPDSVGENVLQYKGLSVDKQGAPTIDYELGGMTVTDAIRAEADGLSRTLRLAGTADGTPYCRVAAGTSLEEVGKGLYAVNDRSYYVRVDPKVRVKRRESNGKQELLLPVSMKNGSGSVQYSIVF
jgi:hypothetical protein